jgi:tRNA U34 5-methylaminomethyl-2-thiouridine-forming methyltransferase MnmC
MKLVLTGDGSHTLFVPDLHEHYHSTFGAVTESMHVFIKAGLHASGPADPLTVLEIGFGTGLNALLACLDTLDSHKNILYYSLEKHPVDAGLIAQLNYPILTGSASDTRQIFQAIHAAPWDATASILDRFRLHKIHGDLTLFIPDFMCDLIFFDAFAPDKQPEMWTSLIFERLYAAMHPGGILTTYCVKGDIRRTMKNVGFRVEKLPGPPGKREILRCIKP